MEFREKVYGVVRQIPKGETMTYREVALLAGSPEAAWAVGNILSKNFDPKIPCHRVIRAEGKTSGYNHGAERRR